MPVVPQTDFSAGIWCEKATETKHDAKRRRMYGCKQAHRDRFSLEREIESKKKAKAINQCRFWLLRRRECD